MCIRDSMVDMAVGIIIGGAFGKIVTSLVNDVIMPPLGMLLGKVDFKDLAITLKAAAVDAAGGLSDGEAAWEMSVAPMFYETTTFAVLTALSISTAGS